MNTDLLNKVEQVYMRKGLPEVNVGDTIEVVFAVVDGGKNKKSDKKRTQTFRGLVIATKGSGVRKSITIRKISYGVGVEKIFPLHSPNVVSIKMLKKGKVRQANIYYMRDRIGKRAMKVKETDFDFSEIVEGNEESTNEIVAEEVAESEVVAEESTEKAETKE